MTEKLTPQVRESFNDVIRVLLQMNCMKIIIRNDVHMKVNEYWDYRVTTNKVVGTRRKYSYVYTLYYDCIMFLQELTSLCLANTH